MTGVAPADGLLARARRMVARSPTAVALAEQVYRSPRLQRTPVFRRFVHQRVAGAEAAVQAGAPPLLWLETVSLGKGRGARCDPSTMAEVMAMDLFRRLVDEASAWGVDSVGLSIHGEPMIDARWIERLQYVRMAGMTYRFSSDASMLTPALAATMLELGGWAEVEFSVQGRSKPVHEATMPPRPRDLVHANIEQFLALRRAHVGEVPQVTVSCVTLAEDELPEFVRYWRPRVDRVRAGWPGEAQQTDRSVPVRGHLPVVDDAGPQMPCPAPWRKMYVYADGRVSPCSEDAALRELILGDANAQTLRQIFHGPAYAGLRERHREERRHEHRICGGCHVNPPWI
ncbi:radical SAM/SPASM domain-containing protein [Nannocystis bainbridge]|uniref:SPASM domain-containing protein n=1 Tax=Nannocystis bainbridge TaxID=2995303 RepID=A0ABT5DZT3_9BACT|nr:SPASM domain-containing protein [Nannocystis bainbridge]MDC0719142.1 SPASM domain-containing protein [Nannocystis bainbridge]